MPILPDELFVPLAPMPDHLPTKTLKSPLMLYPTTLPTPIFCPPLVKFSNALLPTATLSEEVALLRAL